jgi:hypothetical protein
MNQETISLSTRSGQKPVIVIKRQGYFAVHDCIDQFGALAITHIPTGRRILNAVDERQAFRFLDQLQPEDDMWDFRAFNSKKGRECKKQMADKVLRMRETFSKAYGI